MTKKYTKQKEEAKKELISETENSIKEAIKKRIKKIQELEQEIEKLKIQVDELEEKGKILNLNTEISIGQYNTSSAINIDNC